MNTIKHIFTNTKITWKFLIIFSIINGVVVGALNCIPILENTSFVAPAVTFEYWFVAAIFIINNCKSGKETMIKTFLFFLISQPLIYLVEVPFKQLGWELFQYYKYWGIITILTIPGSWIAYQIKRDNLLSAIVLSVATSFLLATALAATKKLITHFPYGLVTALFCYFFSIVLILIILQKKKTRITACIITLVIGFGLFFYTNWMSSQKLVSIFLDDTHQWEVIESDVNTEISGSMLSVNSNKNGTYTIVLQNEDQEVIQYQVIFTEDGTSIKQQ